MNDNERAEYLLNRAFSYTDYIRHMSIAADKIGLRIKLIRTNILGLSQEKFCDLLSELTGVNINLNTYKGWESVKSKKSIPNDLGILAQIAFIGGTTVDWLLTGNDYLLMQYTNHLDPKLPYSKVLIPKPPSEKLTLRYLNGNYQNGVNGGVK